MLAAALNGGVIERLNRALLHNIPATKMLSHGIVSDFISQIDTDQKRMPDLFVNVVARVVETDTNNCPEKTAAKNIQRLESDLLLDYIYWCATA